MLSSFPLSPGQGDTQTWEAQQKLLAETVALAQSSSRAIQLRAGRSIKHCSGEKREEQVPYFSAHPHNRGRDSSVSSHFTFLTGCSCGNELISS